MKRPVGVILASIVLGLIAAAQLLFAALMAFSAYTIGHHGLGIYPPPGSAAATPPPAVLIASISLAFSLFLVLLAAWAIVTIVGLVRLRNWARYSVLVIGGCMAALGLLSVCGIILVAAVSAQAAPTPGVPTHVMQAIWLITALFYAAIAAVGIWWLTYFNLRSVKTFFTPNPYAPNATLPPPPGFPNTPSTPTAIIVIACLFLLSTLGCLIALFLPFPAFLYGFILSGPIVKVIYIALGLLTAAIGIGLLRLDNRARLATYGLIALGAINLCLLATPWYRAGFRSYNLQLTESLRPAWVPPTPPFVFSGPILALSAVFGLAVYAAILWLLHRHRAAFTPPPSGPA
jgi:hypothetical protein